MKYINKLSKEQIINLCKQIRILRLKNGKYKIIISELTNYLELKIFQSSYREYEHLGENLFQLEDFCFTEKLDWDDEESLKAYKIYFKTLFKEFGQQYLDDGRQYFEKYKKTRTEKFKDVELAYKEEMEDCDRILDFISQTQDDIKNEK